MPTALPVDRQNYSTFIGGQLESGKTASIITDTLVNANATITALKAAIVTNALKLSTDVRPIADNVNRALDAMVRAGICGDTHSQTTVAGLIALTYAPAGLRATFAD